MMFGLMDLLGFSRLLGRDRWDVGCFQKWRSRKVDMNRLLGRMRNVVTFGKG